MTHCKAEMDKEYYSKAFEDEVKRLIEAKENSFRATKVRENQEQVNLLWILSCKTLYLI
jgi:hypothetical protein